MADILLDLPIRAVPERLFEALTTPAGLDHCGLRFHHAGWKATVPYPSRLEA